MDIALLHALRVSAVGRRDGDADAILHPGPGPGPTPGQAISAPVTTPADGAPLLLGWREWAALPDLGLTLIKAKVDTGARTSTLHACYVEPFRRHGVPHVRFGVHPLRGRTDLVVHTDAAVLDRRQVRDSGGHREQRYVILTRLTLGGHTWPIEITLSNRETMLFRMLLGRTAIAGQAQVDPNRSFLTGRQSRPARRYGED